MNPKRLVTVLALAVASAAAAPAASALSRQHTSAGDSAAAAVLLRRSDLGQGWASSPPPHSVPALTCPRFHPRTGGVVEVGAAVSPSFDAGFSGPFVAQTAYRYATGVQQARFWRAVVAPRLLGCVSDSLSHASAYGVHFTVARRRQFMLPNLGVAARGYRVSGTGDLDGQTVAVYVDVVALGRGATVTALNLASLEQPVPRRLELRLARIVARRLSSR